MRVCVCLAAYGFVRTTYVAVRTTLRSRIRTFGARTESEPYATYEAPPCGSAHTDAAVGAALTTHSQFFSKLKIRFLTLTDTISADGARSHAADQSMATGRAATPLLVRGLLGLLASPLKAPPEKKNLGAGSSVARRAVIGHCGSLLPRRFGTFEVKGTRADLTAGVGCSWSSGLLAASLACPS